MALFAISASLGCGTKRVASHPTHLGGPPGIHATLGGDSSCAQLGEFGGDNRAGIDRTLHRISCLRNRDGRVIGLTCRAGRAVCGSAALAADIVAQGRSLLLLVRMQDCWCCRSGISPAHRYKPCVCLQTAYYCSIMCL